MVGKIRNWYYWEDGMGPFFRLNSVHKRLLITLAAIVFFSFLVLDLKSLPMKLFGTASLFGIVVLIGFTGKIFYNTTALLATRGNSSILGIIINIWLGCMTGWIITPLYLILAFADISYWIKAKKFHPELLPQKEKPTYKDLTRKDS